MRGDRTDGAADLIVCGGAIHTSDDGCPSPQAFAVCGERFVYAGSAAGAMALRGPGTEVLHADGYAVLPGIVDAHLHLTNLGLCLHRVDLTGARSFDEVVDRTVRFAQETDEEWILGRGWDQHLWPRHAFPTHEALSDALPDRAVALSRVDGHALIANARAMAIAGIDATTADPNGGRVRRDAGGRPTGLLVDAAQELVYGCVPKPTREQLVAATHAAIGECHRWGVTTVAEPGCDEAVLAAYVAMLEEDRYDIRTYAMIHDDDRLIEARLRRGLVDGAYGGRLWVRAIKMYADGALGSRGAALLAPYSDDPENSGLILASQERIERVTERALEHGFQVCVHAIGDRANHIVLNAFETSLRHRRSSVTPRLRVEHAQVIAPPDVGRFAKLGVVPSMQATHARSDMPWARSRLGRTRLAGAYAWRSLLDCGSIVANGTDAPVEPVNTPRTFATSISQHSEFDQRMTRREALCSMTTWAAYANFQERLVGSITPGKYADFVVMDRDWMSVAPEEVEATAIVATYFAGRRVYASCDAPGSGPAVVDSALRRPAR